MFNTYGSSEFLLVGFENPQTILIRESAEKSSETAERLFGTATVPNLFQYNPLQRYIESKDGDLLITANSGTPLIRFNQHDAGAVIPHETIAQEKAIAPHLKKLKWKPWRLPFLSLYGRSDRTLVFYAANIYPEHIQMALNDQKFLKILTGKFVMEKKYIDAMDQQFVIHVEMQNQRSSHGSLTSEIQAKVLETLLSVNSEYADASARLGKDMRPEIVLHENGDPAYFKPGLKPNYIAK
jgi:phenylacetate-CoA ligase